MLGFLRVVSIIWYSTIFIFVLAANSNQLQSKPQVASEQQVHQDQERPKTETQKSNQPVPFEDPKKPKADVPRLADTNNLANLDRKTALGEVNGQAVSLEDLDRLIEFGTPEMQAEFRSGDSSKKQLLQNYLENRAFYLESLASKVDQDPGSDLEARLELVRQQIYANAYLSRELKKISTTEEELRKYYEDYKKEFEIPEGVNASHILVKTEEEAREIRKQLDEGADFAELAKQKSMDTTNKNNDGNLGFILRGTMLPPFEEAAFSLKPGQLSDPVHTTFGYHVIKVLEVRPRTVQAFTDAKKTIEARLLQQKQREWFQTKREELKSRYKVKIYDKYFMPPSSSSGPFSGADSAEANQAEKNTTQPDQR
ncbi:MAG: peptidylprolyl isomerase [Acidobacteria bacterium]|nr:peptidylprolyl isomerase [Acidobacteriota bacterium]